MAVFEGGCLCGAVRYRAEAEPVFTGTCHCSDCQRGTGSAFSCEVAVPTPTVAVTGALTRHTHTGGSGKGVTTAFCPVCGSRLLAEVALMPGITMIAAGTLDNARDFVPEAHIFRDSAQHWFPFVEGMVSFPKMPPMGD